MLQRMTTLALALVLGGRAVPSKAEEFLGEELPAASREAPDGGAKGKRGTASAPRQPASEIWTSRTDRDASEGLAFWGGLGAGQSYVRGHGAIGYQWNPYVRGDATYSYLRVGYGETSGEQYGPELSLVVRLANPTIVTPLAGAGPGYAKWRRAHQGEVFDNGASLTTQVFSGVDIRLTRHFGIRAVRRQTRYLGEPPLRFADRQTPEERVQTTTDVGFQVAF